MKADRLQTLTLGLLVSLLLAGCGGGGGGGTTAPGGSPGTAPTPPQPAPAPAPTVSLSGTLKVPAGHVIDSDVNDVFAELVRNDDGDFDVSAADLARAQPLPNPAFLSGFLMDAGERPAGALSVTGDTSDVYRIEGLGGERILLDIAEPEALDIDLELYDTDLNLVDSSLGVGRLEQVEIPAAGTWYLNVVTLALPRGASNYLLLVGAPPTVTDAPATPDLTDDFIPGQALVRLQPDPAARTRTAGDAARRARERRRWQALADRHDLQQVDTGPLLTLVRRPLPGATIRPDAAAPLGARHGVPSQHRERADAWRTLMALKALHRDPEVLVAEPDHRAHALLRPRDPLYSTQWHYEVIDLPAAWDLTVGNPTTVTAVIDSGIRSAHVDLAGRLAAGGADFVRDPAAAADGDGRDFDPTDPGELGCGNPLGSPQPSVFHGTHVGGTIGAATDNGLGVAGVTWEGALLPIRVLGCRGRGSFSDIVQGIRYAAGLDNDSGRLPPVPADVINLSLGSSAPCSTVLQQTIDEVTARGVVVLAAAGNDARDDRAAPVNAPASCAGVFAVGATGLDGRRAGYSNYGPELDLVAPGGDSATDLNADGVPDGVYSTSAAEFTGSISDGRYTLLQGTSMAAPHASGVAALMKGLYPALDTTTLQQLLAAGALTTDLGPAGWDPEYGHGQIDALRAVEAALTLAAGGVVDAGPPALSVQPPVLELGAVVDRARLTLGNRGGGSLVVNGITSDAPELTVQPPANASDGLGAWLIVLDRSGLASGSRLALLTIDASTGTTEVPVRYQVQPAGSAASAGVQFVLLIDADTDEVIRQVAADAVNGEYAYRFDDVAPGRYRITAGGDNDNDDVICEAGEACGAYITLEAPSTVEVTQAGTVQSGLDFVVAYEQRLADAAGASAATPRALPASAVRAVHARPHPTDR